MGKWLAGIVGSVLVGLIVWSFTHEGGLLNPKKPVFPAPKPEAKQSHIVITSFDVDAAHKNTNSGGRLAAFNDGDTPLENCYVDYWIDRNGQKDGQGISNSFGIPPNQTTNVSFGLYNWGGLDNSVLLVAQVRCGYVVSSPSQRVVPIEP